MPSDQTPEPRLLRRVQPSHRGTGKPVAVAAAAAAALALTALVNNALARRAEAANPPRGRFITVRGVPLHVVERGAGAPLVLLHGNGSMIQDFETSGLLDRAAARYRVIAFDRPGFGHSKRPAAPAGPPSGRRT